jgi:dTMP kinase
MPGGSGKFITFEGGEGAGKSTQIGFLAEHLQTRGITVVTTREPGGSPGAEAIRTLLVEGAADAWDPTSEALLVFAARRDHLRRLILPALARGDWVLCDRFADSTRAYQGYGHGFDLAAIESLHSLAVGDFAPDLTIILDVPVAIGLARAAARRGGENRYEALGIAFHERVREGFRQIAARATGRCIMIDATVPVEAVRERVLHAVGERLGLSQARS